MNLISSTPVFEDDRGMIFDLIEEQVDSISRITFNVGAVRGNHVHKETTQWTFIVIGSLEISTVLSGEVKTLRMSAGDFFVSKPGEPHAMKALTQCEILVFTQGPRSGKDYKSDTFPVKII